MLQDYTKTNVCCETCNRVIFYNQNNPECIVCKSKKGRFIFYCTRYCMHRHCKNPNVVYNSNMMEPDHLIKTEYKNKILQIKIKSYRAAIESLQNHITFLNQRLCRDEDQQRNLQENLDNHYLVNPELANN